MLLSQIAHGQVLQDYHLRCQTVILQSGNHLHLDFRKSRQLHDYISIYDRWRQQGSLTLTHPAYFWYLGRADRRVP
jgi:hypothetical protein